MPLYEAVYKIINYNAVLIYSEYQKNKNIKIAALTPKMDRDALSAYAYCLIVQQIILEKFNVEIPIANELTQIIQYTKAANKINSNLNSTSEIFTTISKEDIKNHFFLPFDIAASNYIKLSKEKFKIGISLHNHTDIFNNDIDRDFCADLLRGLTDDIKTIEEKRYRMGSSFLLLFFVERELKAGLKRLNYTEEHFNAIKNLIYLGDAIQAHNRNYKLREKPFFNEFFNVDYVPYAFYADNGDYGYYEEASKRDEFICKDNNNKILFNRRYIFLDKNLKDFLENFAAIDKQQRQIKTTSNIVLEEYRNIHTQRQLTEAKTKLSNAAFVISSNLMLDRANTKANKKETYCLLVNKIQF